MKIIKTTVYDFNELSEEAKERAIRKLADINVSHEWWDSTYEDAENIGLKLNSFDLDRNRHATGSIIGTHEETAMLIKENHGEDCQTYKIADEFLSKLTALTDLAVKEERDLDDEIDDLNADFLKDLLEEYAMMLQKECDYLQSDKAIIETIESNEYTFTIEGKMMNS